MWKRLLFGRLLVEPARSAAEGRALLRTAPGLIVLLIGGLLTTVLLGLLGLHGIVEDAARVLLVLPLIVLYLGITGEFVRIRYMVRQVRAVLASPRPWQGPRTWRWRVFITSACFLLRVPHRPWNTGDD